jgi:hypothetical protein
MVSDGSVGIYSFVWANATTACALQALGYVAALADRLDELGVQLEAAIGKSSSSGYVS